MAAPTVFIVLAAFGTGCAFGVFAMVPSWWRHRRIARRGTPVAASADVAATPSGSDLALPFPPRDGL